MRFYEPVTIIKSAKKLVLPPGGQQRSGKCYHKYCRKANRQQWGDQIQAKELP